MPVSKRDSHAAGAENRLLLSLLSEPELCILNLHHREEGLTHSTAIIVSIMLESFSVTQEAVFESYPISLQFFPSPLRPLLRRLLQ